MEKKKKEKDKKETKKKKKEIRKRRDRQGGIWEGDHLAEEVNVNKYKNNRL